MRVIGRWLITQHGSPVHLCWDDGGGRVYTVIQQKYSASLVQGEEMGGWDWRGERVDCTPNSASSASSEYATVPSTKHFPHFVYFF